MAIFFQLVYPILTFVNTRLPLCIYYTMVSPVVSSSLSNFFDNTVEKISHLCYNTPITQRRYYYEILLRIPEFQLRRSFHRHLSSRGVGEIPDRYQARSLR